MVERAGGVELNLPVTIFLNPWSSAMMSYGPGSRFGNV